MTNLSKIKRERMLAYLEQLKALNDDEEHIRTITEIENALTEKKYGLVWEEHSEQVDEMLAHNIPVFIEDETRKIVADEEEPYNFLLEGDNLHSLKLLEKTHKGKIDVIYIDPPYNTGAKDWKYNNNFVDATDAFRHSKWLSFMNERIQTAKLLLKDEGILVVAIDHYELAQLIMLLDSVFGEDNRIGIVTVVHKPEGRNQEKFFGTSNEFALFYAKQKALASFSNELIFSDIDEYKEIDEEGIYKLKNFIRMTDGKYATREAKPNFYYPIYVNIEKKDVSLSPKDGYREIYPVTRSGVERTWKTLPNTFLNYYRKGNIELIEDSESGIQIFEKLRPAEVVRTHWIKKEYHSYHYGTKILNDLLGEKKFEFPKSLHLVKDMIKLTSTRNSIILDYFAGSGTTGHAVAQLNAEDGGNRRYILCTNNENNICEEVTYQRLKNIQTDLPHNLKYFKTDFIKKFNQDESISSRMMEHIKELIELENHIEIDGKKVIMLEREEQLTKVLESIQDGGKLFIPSGFFLSQIDQAFLDKKDITVIEIPEYYFRNELREVGEL
ncbi:MAG: site-specific DNA-methyltransferase [Chloroflexi bacterium]|nr:site-specific DNA-methyltransferase [Chloroflexota bacterium]